MGLYHQEDCPLLRSKHILVVRMLQSNKMSLFLLYSLYPLGHDSWIFYCGSIKVVIKDTRSSFNLSSSSSYKDIL